MVKAAVVPNYFQAKKDQQKIVAEFSTTNFKMSMATRFHYYKMGSAAQAGGLKPDLFIFLQTRK